EGVGERLHEVAGHGHAVELEQRGGDRAVGPARHVREPLRRAADEVAEDRAVDLPAQPGDVDEGVVDVPEHERSHPRMLTGRMIAAMAGAPGGAEIVRGDEGSAAGRGGWAGPPRG